MLLKIVVCGRFHVIKNEKTCRTFFSVISPNNMFTRNVGMFSVLIRSLFKLNVNEYLIIKRPNEFDLKK